MAKYRVMEKSYINNQLVEEGQVVDYDGEVSGNLEPIKQTKGKGSDPTEPTKQSADGDGLV